VTITLFNDECSLSVEFAIREIYLSLVEYIILISLWSSVL